MLQQRLDMSHELKFRSIFISDLHLGTSDCQAELLLEFLAATRSEYLYLVGDIVDLWKLQGSVYWPRTKNRIANLVFDKARSGTKVIYIPGNHDELLRDFAGSHINGIDVKLEDVHTTAAGERLLILHGDIFDDLVRNMRWVESLGNNLYELTMIVSRYYNRVRRILGFPYWSFAAFIKYKFKEAVRHIENFEEVAARHAGIKGYDGIVCGHIHHPNQRTLHGCRYLNTGDWVEHCSALTEDHTGRLTLIEWPRMREVLLAPAIPARQAA